MPRGPGQIIRALTWAELNTRWDRAVAECNPRLEADCEAEALRRAQLGDADAVAAIEGCGSLVH